MYLDPIQNIYNLTQKGNFLGLRHKVEQQASSFSAELAGLIRGQCVPNCIEAV